MSRVLVVDDEKGILNIVQALLEDEQHEVQTAVSAEEAVDCLQQQSFDLVLTDLAMPGKSGLDLLKIVKEEAPQTQVIMMTAYATVKTAVEAMRLGAFHYITKPFDNDELVLTVTRCLEMANLNHKVTELEGKLKEKYKFETLIGDSTAWNSVLSVLDRLASVDGPVLITGESGTGKEMVAQAVHYASPRQSAHFEAVNCGAIPETLVESTFFGHTKGAFTGADSDRPGAFERAHGGTLFLDEVSEMPLDTQVKLLRVLQEGEVTPVGSGKRIKVNVRVLAACNKNLEQEVKEGRFREDLYYRLNVLMVELPPLRRRSGDVSLLIDHFLSVYNQKENLSVTGFEKDVRETLEHYPWPGNVRELENAVYRLLVLASGRQVTMDDLPDRIRNASAIGADGLGDISMATAELASIVETTVARLEKNIIVERLKLFDGAKAQTAESLGVSRKTLFNKMKLYDIQ